MSKKNQVGRTGVSDMSRYENGELSFGTANWFYKFVSFYVFLE